MKCPHCNHELSSAEVAALFGSITSDAKAMASRNNGKKGGRPNMSNQNNQHKTITGTFLYVQSDLAGTAHEETFAVIQDDDGKNIFVPLRRNVQKYRDHAGERVKARVAFDSNGEPIGFKSITIV